MMNRQDTPLPRAGRRSTNPAALNRRDPICGGRNPALQGVGRIAVAAALVVGLARPELGPAVAAVPAPALVEAPPHPHPVVDAVAELLEVLDRYGLPIDAGRGVEAATLALARVADPQARLFSEVELAHWEDFAGGRVLGVGLHLSRSNLQTRVTGVTPGSPAAEAGLRPGDRLASVNGRDAVRLNIAEITAALRGSGTNDVTLAVETDGQEPVEHTLARRRFGLPAVEEHRLLPTGLGYIRLNGLYPGAGAEVQRILAEWGVEAMSGLVLDLRGANGRDLESVAAVASMLATPGAELFSFVAPDGERLSAFKAVRAERLRMPVMVLVDEGTTGAAEVLASVASASTKGAMLIGRTTAGDPMIREPVALREGIYVYVATRRLVNADGSRFAGHDGVVPDIRVAPHSAISDYEEPEPPILTDRRETTDQEIAAGQLQAWIRGDAPLTRAVDVLLGLKALNLLRVGHGDPDDR